MAVGGQGQEWGRVDGRMWIRKGLAGMSHLDPRMSHLALQTSSWSHQTLQLLFLLVLRHVGDDCRHTEFPRWCGSAGYVQSVAGYL